MTKIKLYLTLFFLAVTIPSGVLLYRSFEYLEKEALYSYRQKAELITQIINKKVVSDIEVENRRSYAEYRFLMVVKVIGGEEIILSPLAAMPYQSSFKGLLGYFQIDPDGTLTSPALPEGALGTVELQDRRLRKSHKDQIQRLINPQEVLQYGLTQKIRTRSLEINADKLSDADIKTEDHIKIILSPKDSTNIKARYEASTAIQDFIFDVEADPNQPTNDTTTRKESIDRSFQDVEVHPFKANFIEGHIVFHRNVFRGSKRFVQGFLVKTRDYFDSILSDEVKFASLQSSYFIKLGDEQNLIGIYGDWYSPKNSIYGSQLEEPISKIKIDIGYNNTESPPGSQILLMLGGAILLVLLVGIYGIYRLLKENIRITQKRSDFISAVSHELKTPLTAIRMFSEMLLEGFVTSDQKRMEYYQRISSESNRLSRLIKNILDLSKLERSQSSHVLTPEGLDNLILAYCDTFSPQIKEQGFDIELDLGAPNSTHLLDRDGFSQILINVIENSIKFSQDSPNRVVRISTRSLGKNTELTLRDFGSGVPSNELPNIFDPFYRVEQEMIRKTSGTGIGLSLVKELCRAMNIKLEAKNAHPGLILQFTIPSVEI
jgi:two-component system phosphate regulon sensor histidine kinase PhoR